MLEIWNTLLFNPLLNVLVFLHQLTGNLGASIIILTIGLRTAMTPLIIPGLRMTKKIQELNPELTKLKQQYKDDKQALMLAQSELYKKHGANPASGCLPQIVQILVLIALFQVLNLVITHKDGNLAEKLNPNLYAQNKLPSDFVLKSDFLGLSLLKPDSINISGIPIPGLLLILTGLVQLISSKQIMPEVTAEKKAAEKTEESFDDAMIQTQQQMLYLFPILTVFFGYQFPSGLVLYWFVFSVVSLVQQYIAIGPAGLTPWAKRIGLLK